MTTTKLTDVGGEDGLIRQFLEVGHDNDGNNIGGDVADAVVLAPDDSARNVIQPSAADAVALTLKGHAAQTADLFKVTSGAGAGLLEVTSEGDLLIGGPTPSGAGFQSERTYTDPAGAIFNAFYSEIEFVTDTIDDQPFWIAHRLETTFSSDQGGPIYETDGLFSKLNLVGDNPIPGDNPVYNTYAGAFHTRSDPSSSANWWNITGFWGLGEHAGTGTANLIAGGVFDAKLQTTGGALSDSLVGVFVAVENLSDTQSPDGYGIWINPPIFEGHTGGLASYYGLYVASPEDPVIDNSYAIWTEDGPWFMGNATAPGSNPTGGGFMYANAGALYWRGSGGTITKIADA